MQAYLARLRGDDPQAAYAVRSSALTEDSARASFAGEFETVLGVRSDEAVREAIVARELGIPAVVNCGDATGRLKTGDRVRLDGTAGVVEILGTG